MFASLRLLSSAVAAAVLAASLQAVAAAEAIGALPITYAQGGAQAVATLTGSWFTAGYWKMCQGCSRVNHDWGADSLTYALFEAWNAKRDPRLVPYFTSLENTAPNYGGSCRRGTNCTWSDVPMWDSIAASRDYGVTHDNVALQKAVGAFHVVDGATAFAFGACPSIDYQRPNGTTALKTLETDSNYIKAAVLLYQSTKDASYLVKATEKYAAVRKYFLDPVLPLYTVYVFDNGSSCVQTPHRFFASVNGNMIDSGLYLYMATRNGTYLSEAVATAKAVSSYLSDANGVFADLQAENDLVAPLVEAMHDLVTVGKQQIALPWILKNAAAASGEKQSDGSYGRFFDGPVPPGLITAFQTNGGLALAIAASDLGGNAVEPQQSDWHLATYFSKTISVGDTVTFTGTAIALIGNIGDRCCSSGHARVFVDGVETVDGTGIWQNKSSSGRDIPNSILFAWRWPTAGLHTISFAPGVENAKEGSSYLHVMGYYVKTD